MPGIARLAGYYSVWSGHISMDKNRSCAGSLPTFIGHRSRSPPGRSDRNRAESPSLRTFWAGRGCPDDPCCLGHTGRRSPLSGTRPRRASRPLTRRAVGGQGSGAAPRQIGIDDGAAGRLTAANLRVAPGRVIHHRRMPFKFTSPPADNNGCAAVEWDGGGPLAPPALTNHSVLTSVLNTEWDNEQQAHTPLEQRAEEGKCRYGLSTSKAGIVILIMLACVIENA